MKILNKWKFIGMMIAGLIHSSAPLWAQPSTGPVSTSNRSTPTMNVSAPIDGESISAEEPDRPWNQGISMETRQAARELFLEGNRLFRIPLFVKAAEQYVTALSKWKHPAFYFNLAFAQLNSSQEVEARESLEQAIAYGQEPLGEKEFLEAQKQLEQVKRQLGRIHLTCQTQGAEVTLDGVTLFIGPGSYDGWIKANAHEFTAKKAGYQSEARRVIVSAGELLDINLSLITLSRAADISRRWAVWKPWTAVAAGIAVASASGVLHAVASRNFNAFDEKFSDLICAQSQGCLKEEVTDKLNERLARARRQQKIATSGYGLGGALIAAGVVLLYLNRPRLTEEVIHSSNGKVVIAPAVSDDMFGLLISASH